MNNANEKAPWEPPGSVDRSGGSQEGLGLSAPSHLVGCGGVENDSSGLRTASYVALFTGVTALGGAGMMRLLAQKDLNALEARLDNGRILSTDTEALMLRDSLAQKSNILTGLLAGGGAAVATGAVLFLLSPSSATPPPATVGISTDGDGASAILSGTF
jgi:hypothetical protein